MLFGKKKFNFLTMIILYFKSVPAAAVYRTLMTFVNALTPTFSIIVTARFLDAAVAAAGDRSKLNEVYIPLILLIILSLYSYYARVVTHLVMMKMWNKLRIAVMPEIAERKAKIKFKYYENQEKLDILERVTGGFDGWMAGFYDYVINVAGTIVQVMGFLVVLGAQVWWSPIVFIISCVPSYIVAYVFGKKQYDNEKELTKIDRKAGYYYGVLTSRDTVEERYTYGYTPNLNEKYKIQFEKARISRKNINKRQWTTSKLVSIITFLSGVLVIGILVPLAIFPDASGNIRLSIGMFTSLVGTVLNISSMMQWRLSNYVQEFKYKMEYLKDFNTFLEFEEEENADCLPDEKIPVLEKIEFKNLSFKYPGTEPYILKNFNLELKAGKHYAIVGINGAGKTTLTKLLTRLYDDYEGEILINGRELREYSQGEIKALAAVVYQDFSRYPLDFYNNIAIGNILDRENRDTVENAVKIIGLTDVVEKLPRKYETPITKIKEDGVDLSGGEWQRIALARLIVNSAPLKILDEPTAALDPISESRVYEQFGEIVSRNHASETQGITIFISHRLGSTKLADEIVIISNGKVEEQGTFDELMEKSGLYAQMFESQAEWYKDGNNHKSNESAEKVYV